MYNVLTKLKGIETTQVGFRLEVLVKFRNEMDGMVDVHVHGSPAVSVERNGDGYKVFANDSTWIRCEDVDRIYVWTLQKLSEIMGAEQIS